MATYLWAADVCVGLKCCREGNIPGSVCSPDQVAVQEVVVWSSAEPTEWLAVGEGCWLPGDTSSLWLIRSSSFSIFSNLSVLGSLGLSKYTHSIPAFVHRKHGRSSSHLNFDLRHAAHALGILRFFEGCLSGASSGRVSIAGH